MPVAAVSSVSNQGKTFDNAAALRIISPSLIPAAEIWAQGARKIERGEVILPNDPALFAQLTTRRIGADSRGRIVLEAKDHLRARGLPSPDRANAVLGCMYAPKCVVLLYA